MKKSVIALVIFSTTFVACVSEKTNSESTTQQEQVETLPLREVKDINIFVEQIKSSPEWLKVVEEKAKQQSISLDSMLMIDAVYLQTEDAEIVKIENEIIQNQEWLDLVKKKAQANGISIDDAIRSDANFMFQENKKSNTQQ